MKIRIVLFLLAISFSSFGQKVQFLDSIALNRVNPDEVEYVNLSAQGNLVIEGSSNVLLDISTMDIPAKGVDSVVISLDKKRYKTRALSPFLISNLNESVKVKVEAFSGSDTLSFISSKSKALELSVERRNKPTFTSDTIVFGLLALILALVFYTSHKQTKFWNVLHDHSITLALLPHSCRARLVRFDLKRLFQSLHYGKRLPAARCPYINDARN